MDERTAEVGAYLVLVRYMRLRGSVGGSPSYLYLAKLLAE